jgi:hypothetical protein
MKVLPIPSYRGTLKFDTLVISAPRICDMFTHLAFQDELENRHLVVFSVPRTATGQVNWPLVVAIDQLIQANTGPE